MPGRTQGGICVAGQCSRDEHMKITQKLDPVQLRGILIEHGRAFLCVGIGAGRLIPLVDVCLLDFAACDYAVRQATDRPLARPEGDWHDALRQLVNAGAVQ